MNIPTPTADFDVVTPQPTGIEKADRCNDLIADILKDDDRLVSTVGLRLRKLTKEDAELHGEALKNLHATAAWVISRINQLHGRLVMVPIMDADGKLSGTWHAIDGQY